MSARSGPPGSSTRSSGAAVGVEWRRLRERLWVGRRDGYPLDPVERLGALVTVDTAANTSGPHAPFEQAEEAILADSRASGVDRAGRVLRTATLLAAVMTVGLAIAGLVTVLAS